MRCHCSAASCMPRWARKWFVCRLHDLRFSRYPKIWLTTLVAAAIYANFFTHHFIFDMRRALLAAIALLFWIAENIATWAGAWLYPNQEAGWEPVSPQKLVSWFLLMIISVVMVTWVYPPKPPAGEDRPAA